MQTLRKVVLVAAVLVLAVPALAHPGSGVLVDPLGQVYFIDTGSGVWKIDTKGALEHLSPLRNHWLAMDPTDRFTQARLPTDPGRDWVITAAGSSPTILISTDFPIVIGDDGNLYYPSVRESSVRIMRAAPTQPPTAFVTLPRSAAGGPIRWINGLAAGRDGSLYYTENNAVRRITVRGEVSTVATVAALANGPNIPGSESRPYLRGLKVDAKGTMYVADAGDARLLKITPDGKLSTILQLESPWAPTDVAVFGDILYVLEFLHTASDDRTEWMPRIRKITPDGKSTIIITADQLRSPTARGGVDSVSADSVVGAARPLKRATSVSPNVSWVGFLDLLLRFFILAT